MSRRPEKAIEFRQRPWSDTWHFSTNCRWWLASGDMHRIVLRDGAAPNSGELCNLCQAKQKNGTATYEFV